MQWMLAEIPSLLKHLPQAVHDLIDREDAGLVTAAREAISPLAPEEEGARHRIAGAEGAPPAAGIEKSPDPFIARDAQNMGLLLHDYLYHLPAWKANSREGEKLLAHWRQLLLDQPRRLAVAKQSYWNTPEAREYWRHRLLRYRTDAGLSIDSLPEWEEWQRLIGEAPHPLLATQLPQEKVRQWQDLVIRSRLHAQTKERSMEW